MENLTDVVLNMNSQEVYKIIIWPLDNIIYGTFKNGDIRTIDVVTDN